MHKDFFKMDKQILPSTQSGTTGNKRDARADSNDVTSEYDLSMHSGVRLKGGTNQSEINAQEFESNTSKRISPKGFTS